MNSKMNYFVSSIKVEGGYLVFVRYGNSESRFCLYFLLPPGSFPISIPILVQQDSQDNYVR